MTWLISFALHYTLQLVVLVRALTRPDREPTSRLAWALVILALPGVGIVLYLFLGEVTPGRRAVARMRRVDDTLPRSTGAVPVWPAPYHAVFGRAAAINGFSPVTGNAAVLTADSADTIARLVADIDAATDSVHILVYIWLEDASGRALMAAVMRAALRGVACRCMVDGLGSRALVAGAEWARMRAAGVQTGVAFSTRWAGLRLLIGRIDIRNHRKIMVIDGRIAYCGSQNCADAAFAIKARFAPWVDIMARIEGPVVWQTQRLFVADWMAQTGEDIASALAVPAPEMPGGFTALAFGTGPGVSPNAVPDVVTLALAAAQHEVMISTPYFVPTLALAEQIRSTALRGVAVTLILPARNDSRFVALASRSGWASLLGAGVAIHEYRPGLLHAKTLTVDGALAMIGSANLDLRSFDLNFENNLLIADPAVAGAIRARQLTYLADSAPVAQAEVDGWSLPRRLIYDVAATISPVL